MSHVQLTKRQSALICSSQTRMDVTAPLRVFGGARATVQTLRRATMVHAHEAALLMSGAATAPRRLVSGGYKQASSMSPHATAHAAPRTPPVLLVHGFGGSKSHWSLVAKALSAGGLNVKAITYAPLGTSVERLAGQLVADVEVVTLGSPFGGSPWAGLLPFFEIVRALRRGSPLLRRLASTPLPEGVRWLSVTAALDIIVPGLRSVPFHAQVETITVNDVGHLGMLKSGQVIGCIAAALCQQSAASAAEEAIRLLPNAS